MTNQTMHGGLLSNMTKRSQTDVCELNKHHQIHNIFFFFCVSNFLKINHISNYKLDVKIPEKIRTNI